MSSEDNGQVMPDFMQLRKPTPSAEIFEIRTGAKGDFSVRFLRKLVGVVYEESPNGNIEMRIDNNMRLCNYRCANYLAGILDSVFNPSSSLANIDESQWCMLTRNLCNEIHINLYMNYKAYEIRVEDLASIAAMVDNFIAMQLTRPIGGVENNSASNAVQEVRQKSVIWQGQQKQGGLFSPNTPPEVVQK